MHTIKMINIKNIKNKLPMEKIENFQNKKE